MSLGTLRNVKKTVHARYFCVLVEVADMAEVGFARAVHNFPHEHANASRSHDSSCAPFDDRGSLFDRADRGETSGPFDEPAGCLDLGPH